MADVFISYHTKTASGVAKAIADDLERHGVSCWYARRNVTVGAYAASIIETIDNCKVFLLILNESATHSERVLSELNAAFRRFDRHEAIALLPVRVDNCPLSRAMRYYLGPIHIKDFSSADGIPVEKITEIVSDILKTFAAQSQPETKDSETRPERSQGSGLSSSQINNAPVHVFAALLVAFIAIFWVLLFSNVGPHFLSLQSGEMPENASDDTESAFFTYDGQLIPLYNIPKNQLKPGDFIWKNSRLRYVGSQFDVSLGVSVSAYQNHNRGYHMLDWEAAKADGVEFAIVRIVLRGATSGSLWKDAYYDQNIDGAMSAGLTTGVYIYSSAISVKEALEDAYFVLNSLFAHSINGPVVYVWEIHDASYRNFEVSMETATQCAKAFCECVKEAGYTPMICVSKYVGYIKYDLSELPYLKWYPQYASRSSNPYPDFRYWVDIWQFSDSMEVDGIGTTDANLWFRPKISEGAEN